ncbi:MAG: hypothetical protein PHU06_12120 [Gallionella sp.]|nr:hypothetical protein [Gallionella sp.]MDD4959708.1 hypothetical protein [Gallionella sp.]
MKRRLLKIGWAIGIFSLSGCAILSGSTPACQVLDPDLAQGVYHGGCQEGLADGYGEVTGESTYRGDFRAGKKHGLGVKVMSNGDRYEGMFYDDYRHGLGTYIWGNGSKWAGERYSGNYDHDLRHGWGVFQWENGDRYEGEWENDTRKYASAMEVRRLQTEAARLRVVGAEVCNARPFIIDEIYHPMRGVIEAAGHTKRVRLTAIEGNEMEYRGQTVKIGDVLEDDSARWPLCGKN